MKRKLKRLFYTNKSKMLIYLFTIIVFLVPAILFSISIIRLSGIETTIRIIVLFLIACYFFYYIYKCYYYIVNKNKVKFYISTIFTIILAIIFIILSYFINIVYGELGNLTQKDTSLYTGYLISLADTDKKDIKTVGIINDTGDIEGFKIANMIIKENKLKYELKSYDNYDDMIYDLYNNNLDGAFVQNNYLSYFTMDETYLNIASETKVIYKKSSEEKNNINISSNKSLNEPFTVLLLGVDSTENNIDAATSLNGDTLMLITFNPRTLNATIFSIPRDLYVPIACRRGSKAKINSSSGGGVNCVIDTIEDLIDIDIDYYAKINFRGVVDLVEALKGIDVEVTYPFCEQDSNRNIYNQICLKKGYQHLNGEETLAYARHRHSLPSGDLQRIQNQQLIVEAMSRKLLTLNTVTEFKDILSAISNNIVTSMSRDQILSSYNILKDMVINLISDKDALVVSKAYLEVYDNRIYNERTGTYSAALGYYDESLNDIIKMMKVNLELEKAEMITDFSFDANTPYEVKVAGKGLKTGANIRRMVSFVGKTVSEAENWGNTNNITIQKEYVTSDNPKYNSNVPVGLIANQSIASGMSLDNIKTLTIYINSTSE